MNKQKTPTRVSRPVSLLIRFLRSKFPASRSNWWGYSKHFGEIITIRTLQGLFSIRTDDQAIGRSLFVNGHYELDLARKVKELLESLGYCGNSKECILLDIGANIGVISIGMLKDGFFKRAIAIEPEPTNYNLLTENISINGLREQIHTYQNALSSVAGEVEFELSKDNFGDHRVKVQGADATTSTLFGEQSRRTIKVPSITLDSIASSVLDGKVGCSPLIWIDVQGHEGYVFEGGKNLLRRGIPTVSEIWPYGILKSGMTLESFSEIVSNLWTDYWILRKRGFVRYPIETFHLFLNELGVDGEYDNVVFTRTLTEAKLQTDFSKS